MTYDRALLWKEVSDVVLPLISEVVAQSHMFDIVILFGCHKKNCRKSCL